MLKALFDRRNDRQTRTRIVRCETGANLSPVWAIINYDGSTLRSFSSSCSFLDGVDPQWFICFLLIKNWYSSNPFIPSNIFDKYRKTDARKHRVGIINFSEFSLEGYRGDCVLELEGLKIGFRFEGNVDNVYQINYFENGQIPYAWTFYLGRAKEEQNKNCN